MLQASQDTQSTPSNDTSQPSFTPGSNNAPSPSSSSVEGHLERLTNAVHEVGDHIQACKETSEARHATAEAREEAAQTRTLSVQEQLARMLAMTQETLRREKEERVTSVSSPQKYAQDLQRAAFGAGGTPDSISRSSMMDSGTSTGAYALTPPPSLRASRARVDLSAWANF
ncbi:hypothetical protein C8Q79DRAFT_1008309 [Trametes meyenii]|nr:hypothetical protein C8Q79DRAFT_1008309 [Trametes meyenii]